MPASPPSPLDPASRDNDDYEVVLSRLRPKEALATLAGAPPAAESMCIWYCTLKDSSFLSRFPSLRILSVAGWEADSLDDLRHLPQLRGLRILHLPKIRDLAPLAALRHLQYLYLETLPSWDGSNKANTFKSAAPLAGLSNLLRLVIRGTTHFEKGGIRPLAALTGLESLDLPRNLPIGEVAYLAAKLPNTESPSFKPHFTLDNLNCRKCGAPIALFTASPGPRRPASVCTRCKAQYVAEHTAEFNRLRDLAAAEPNK